MKIGATIKEHKTLHAYWLGLGSGKRLFEKGKLVTENEIIERHRNITKFLESKNIRLNNFANNLDKTV